MRPCEGFRLRLRLVTRCFSAGIADRRRLFHVKHSRGGRGGGVVVPRRVRRLLPCASRRLPMMLSVSSMSFYGFDEGFYDIEMGFYDIEVGVYEIDRGFYEIESSL